MSPVTQHVHILAITITIFSKVVGVWEAFSHSFLMGTFSSLFLLLLQHVCSHFKLFLPLTSHLSAFFHLFNLFLPSYSTTFWPFQSFFTFLSSYPLLIYSFLAFSDICFSAFSAPIKPLKLFCPVSFLKYSPFCLFNSFKHSFMFSSENVKLYELF